MTAGKAQRAGSRECDCYFRLNRNVTTQDWLGCDAEELRDSNFRWPGSFIAAFSSCVFPFCPCRTDSTDPSGATTSRALIGASTSTPGGYPGKSPFNFLLVPPSASSSDIHSIQRQIYQIHHPTHLLGICHHVCPFPLRRHDPHQSCPIHPGLPCLRAVFRWRDFHRRDQKVDHRVPDSGLAERASEITVEGVSTVEFA